MCNIGVVTLCSGYDAQCLSLERLRRHYPRFSYELLAWAEIDKYAIEAHNALFPQYRDRNLGDITSCDWSVISARCDLLTYSTPCTSISVAGKQEGLKRGSGTASSIIWSVLNAIDVLRPRILLMENVKALVSRKFIGDFHEWQQELSKRGYSNFAKVLNSKDFGVPQNRERVFMVSILGDDERFYFPKPFPLDKKLKDVLEEEVDEKYYLSQKLVDYIYSNGGKNGNIQGGVDVIAPTVMFNNNNSVAIADPQCLTMRRTEHGKEVLRAGGKEKFSDKAFEPRNDGICNTLTSVPKDNLVVEPFNPYEDGTCRTLKAQYYKNGMANFKRSDGLGATAVKVIGNIYENNIQGGRVYDKDGISPTIGANSGGNIQPKILDVSKNTSFVYQNDFRIRKLTERECFRLQGVDDADIDKIQAAGISRSQQYKMAGNSITVDVLFHIFRKLFIDKDDENQQLSLF